MNPIVLGADQLINLFEGESLRAYGTFDIFLEDSDLQIKPIKAFVLDDVSSSSLGRYSVSISLDDKLISILREKEKIKLEGYGDGQKEFLKSFFRAAFVEKKNSFLLHFDNLFRQGLRDTLICAGLFRPPEIDKIISETVSKSLAFIPDSGVILRAILSRQILNSIGMLGIERFFVAIPRLCFWELENMASDSKRAYRKRHGFRGLQEIESLKRYPTQIFDVQIPMPYIIPSKRGSKLSSDALIRFQIMEYARKAPSLVDACFITCDKTTYAVAKLEEISCYCISLEDIFTMPKKISVPSWNLLLGKIYVPLSTFFYELAVHFGTIKIASEPDLEIWVKAEFSGKKAEDWIRGAAQVHFVSGNTHDMKKDIQTPSRNIKKVKHQLRQ